MSVLKFWLWLSAAQNVSVNTKARLLRYYRDDAEAMFFAPDGEFFRLPGINKNEAAVLEKRDIKGAEELIERCDRDSVAIVTMQDALYPERLRRIFAPPAVIYVKGRLPAMDDEAAVAVIGTRRATQYGLRMGRDIAYEIAKCGGVVISGLTNGIDAAAAKGALLADGVCVGVLGTSIDDEHGALAKAVAERGALISEYPPKMPPLRSFFRDRNRISAGLSAGVVVVEAPERSGTRLFAAEAAEQGKEIFAVPGNADADSCVGSNAMLKEGAKLVTNGMEVMEEFTALFPKKIIIPHFVERLAEESGKNIPAPAKKDIDKEKGREYIDLQEQLAGLSDEQLNIITAIGGDVVHVDNIIEKTGLGAAKVLSQLTFLEIKGFVRREPGRRIALNTAKK